MTSKIAVLSSVLISFSSFSFSWSNHTLITRELVSAMPSVNNAAFTKVETLEAFLMANESALEVFLAKQEAQMRESLWHYDPRPDALAFTATGDANTIRDRFTRAIRINPHTKIPLYLQLLPAEQRTQPTIAATDVSVFNDVFHLADVQLVQLEPGQLVTPVDVVSTASDEPDHGMDIGLFTDSNTDYGLEYGFGTQPFGNAAIEYGTQAPFHMGFYDEASILYAVGGFLKRTHPEYRILLFKQLSEFAFANGHDYWGWRFMGWGLHYIGDFSNPYHVTPLPGNSTMDTLIPGILGVIGLPKSQANSTQLTSNRHTAIEQFQEEVMIRAIVAQDTNHQTLQALVPPPAIRSFENSHVVDTFAQIAYDKSDAIDQILMTAMPARLVNDASIEYSELGVAKQLPEIVIEQSGDDGYQMLITAIADLLGDFSHNAASYVYSIRNAK